jgi:DNA-binding response OmpR family regulator
VTDLLCNKTILVVEDEALITLYVTDLLEDLGCQAVVPAHDLATATAAVNKQIPDLALLDLKIGDEFSYPIAEMLVKAGVPIIFSTGFTSDVFEKAWQDYPRLIKPYTPQTLEASIQQAFTART